MYKKILLALDMENKRLAKKLTQTAVIHAKLHNSHIHVVNVVPGLNVPSLVAGFLPEDAVKQALSQAKSELKQFCKKNIPAKLESSFQLCSGTIYKKILKEIEKTEPDLIIIGHQSKKRIERYFLGSVASKVAEHCPANIMIIKE